jgi:hypothetical protein
MKQKTFADNIRKHSILTYPSEYSTQTKLIRNESLKIMSHKTECEAATTKNHPQQKESTVFPLLHKKEHRTVRSTTSLDAKNAYNQTATHFNGIDKMPYTAPNERNEQILINLKTLSKREGCLFTLIEVRDMSSHCRRMWTLLQFVRSISAYWMHFLERATLE